MIIYNFRLNNIQGHTNLVDEMEDDIGSFGGENGEDWSIERADSSETQVSI